MKGRRSPWVGDRRDLGGQRFECIAIDHVRSRRGHAVPVLRWRSACADCGEPFEFRTCRKTPDGYLVRRCREHLSTSRKARRLRRLGLGLGVPTPGLLDMLVSENPDGSIASMAQLVAPLQTTRA